VSSGAVDSAIALLLREPQRERRKQKMEIRNLSSWFRGRGVFHMRRTESSSKSVRKYQKAVKPAASRTRGSGKRAVNRTAIRRRNDGPKSTKPNRWKIPVCICGGTKFAVAGGDGMEYVALKCQSCGEDRVLRVRGSGGDGCAVHGQDWNDYHRGLSAFDAGQAVPPGIPGQGGALNAGRRERIA
jgi:hypothetical protein